jgi:predicted DNA binding protein
MRKGVESIAARLGISRVTAYSYLEEARNQDAEEAAGYGSAAYGLPN